MCDPFACVRPMCPVCVPAPPGIFLPVCVPAPLAPSESFYRYQYFGAAAVESAADSVVAWSCGCVGGFVWL